MTAKEASSGMEGVVVADTRLSRIDAEEGRFSVRGHDIGTLCQSLTFEGMCALLWDESSSACAAENMRAFLGRGRTEAFALVPSLSAALSLPDSMDALRTAVSHLQLLGDRMQVRAHIAGAVTVFAAAWQRLREREEPVAPRPDAAHAADYLYMLRGRDPGVDEVATLNAYLVALAEHDLMASTFTVRVIASTNADPVSAIVGGLGALKGSAHGGAIAPVLEMIRAVRTPERAKDWIREELDAGRHIMGMGHRVYRTRDPRATALESVLHTLDASGHRVEGLAVARAIELAAQQELGPRQSGRRIAANVELFAAVLLNHLGIQPELFTPTLAASCVAGWLAHYDEQIIARRLIRPRSRYVGPA